MTITQMLVSGLASLAVLIAIAITFYEAFEGRRRDRRAAIMLAREIVRVPLFETRTMWVDGEPHSIKRQLHHAPRHNRGVLYEDLSLTRFEKDQDDGR